MASWFTKQKPVRREVSATPLDASAKLAESSAKPAEAPAQTAGVAGFGTLPDRVASIEARLLDAERAVATLASRHEPRLADANDKYPAGDLRQQLAAVQLQCESMMASQHESTASHEVQQRLVGELLARVASAEARVAAVGVEQHTVEQLTTAVADLERRHNTIEPKLAELADLRGNLEQLRAEVSAVRRDSDLVRSAYLARDAARLREAARRQRVATVLTVAALLISIAALLLALRGSVGWGGGVELPLFRFGGK